MYLHLPNHRESVVAVGHDEIEAVCQHFHDERRRHFGSWTPNPFVRIDESFVYSPAWIEWSEEICPGEEE